MSVSFDNTEIAFSPKSDRDLKRAHFLFKMVGKPWLVKTGKVLTNIALSIRFPLGWIIKPTIFKQFCGGETIEECSKTVDELGEYGIGTILDYSVEGKEDTASFQATAEEVINTIKKGNGDARIPFSVFKLSGISRFSLLEKVSASKELSAAEKDEWKGVHERLDAICSAAHSAKTPVLIDAEETWIQPAIDALAEEMMGKYNKEYVSVYNTVQIYRWDRLDYLKQVHKKAQEEGYLLAVKLVRGAYMEKEADRAEEKKYKNPIQPSKDATDKDYNLALRYCVEHVNEITLMAGTHNESSSALLVDLMGEFKIDNSDERIYFAQLYGMSDHISYNLSNAGYKVAKYVPYGPVREVIPYLIRRAEENTSVAGQTSRELSLILKEKKRRQLK